ncbi:MAG: hypothetical protein KJ077_22470 [Anaerolineae bacterium]|nr:hypothetical protein [Anaerolineae bacterium]
MTVSQYPDIIEAFIENDSPPQDGEAELLELLEATLIDQDKYEILYGMPEYSSEMINHKRSRHGYSYYTSTSR